MAFPDLTLYQLPLNDLELACRSETRRFQRGEPSDQRYCLEIFRRALQHLSSSVSETTSVDRYADEAARNMLVSLYSEYIRAQINRAALPRQWHDDLVQDVWRNFWMAANHGLMFNTLAGALAYLRQATVSVVIKYCRTYRARAREESLQALVERDGEAPLSRSITDPTDSHWTFAKSSVT